MKKILVIGGGPGGYVAAIKAAQMGAEVHIAEQNCLGGVCLNVGCIPTKSLLHSTLFFKHVKDGDVAGVRAEKVTLDWSAVQAHKQSVVNRLVGGVSGLLKANKVTVHQGKAVFTAPGQVTVNGKSLPKMDAIIIASGSLPVRLNFPGADLPEVIDSTGALALEKVPKSIGIVGGGVIGVEFASIFAAAGAKVTIVELLPEILPSVDGQIARMARAALEKSGIEIMTGAKLTAVRKGSGTGIHDVHVDVEIGGQKKSLPMEKVLIGVGRKPNTESLSLEKAGVKTERGAIKVDRNFETSTRGVFAIGDCNAQIMLAHAASAQGEAAVEYILTGKHHYDPGIIPSCIYTEPEIATIGLTEDAAKKQGMETAVGVFDLAGNGKAMIDGCSSGLIKIVADRQLGEISGVHMIGPHVTEMIAEAAAVMKMEGLVEDLIQTVHPHPTVNEAVGEAAMAVFGNAIHWPPKRV